MLYTMQRYSAIMFPFMPGPILSLYILVSTTSVMIFVLITDGYSGHAQGVTSHDYFMIFVTLVAKTWSIEW